MDTSNYDKGIIKGDKWSPFNVVKDSITHDIQL